MKIARLLIAPVTGAVLIAFSGIAVAQDSAAPADNQAQSQTSKKHHKATAAEGNPNGDQTTDTGSSSGSQLSQPDKMFLRKAAQGGLEEVEIGQMVASKAQDAQVKAFAQRMVDDHSKANDELKSLAQQKGYNLPTEMDAQGKAMKAKLEKLDGAQLDKAYMQNMVKDHTKDVQEFKTESQSAKDNDVKQWAQKTLPTLQEHLKQAKEINSKTGTSGSQTAQQ